MTELMLIQDIESQVKTLAGLGLTSEGISDLTSHWKEQVDQEPGRFINNDLSINAQALRNFRRLDIFVADIPAGRGGLKAIFGGSHRSGRKILRDTLATLKERGYYDLLRKHPCPDVGNPRLFGHEGFRYTLIWLKNIYFLGLLNKALGSNLDPEFVALDIGSSYGHFSGVVKREYPNSHHVLVDFPEQLLLAQYFLSEYLPDARIAGAGDVSKQEKITREYISGYDFVLVPCQIFDRLEGNTVDLVTNFVSFGEMGRKWFDTYVNSPTFQTATYLLTSNRVLSSSTYDTDMKILDYPISDPKKIHFGVCPIQSPTLPKKKFVLLRGRHVARGFRIRWAPMKSLRTTNPVSPIGQ